VPQVIDKALVARASWKMRVEDAELNEVIRDALAGHTLPARGRRVLKVYAATQLPDPPPVFLITVNDRKLIHFGYERYLENQMRARWPFEGAPLRLMFRNGGRGGKKEP